MVSNEGTHPTLANGFHTDVAGMEQPSLGSMIYMTEVPANGGGDTLFADSYCAYLGMPAAWKRKLRGVQALNDYRLFLRRDQELRARRGRGGGLGCPPPITRVRNH